MTATAGVYFTMTGIYITFCCGIRALTHAHTREDPSARLKQAMNSGQLLSLDGRVVASDPTRCCPAGDWALTGTPHAP